MILVKIESEVFDGENLAYELLSGFGWCSSKAVVLLFIVARIVVCVWGGGGAFGLCFAVQDFAPFLVCAIISLGKRTLVVLL